MVARLGIGAILGSENDGLFSAVRVCTVRAGGSGWWLEITAKVAATLSGVSAMVEVCTSCHYMHLRSYIMPVHIPDGWFPVKARGHICAHAGFGPDEYSGNVMYGYTLDSCPDNNVFCKNDANHLDISEAYLISKDIRQGSRFNARKLHWDYIDYVPEECAPEPLDLFSGVPHIM